MSERSLPARLRIGSGQTVRAVDPPAGYAAMLADGLPPGVEFVDDGQADQVHLFSTSVDELAGALPAARAAVKPDGLLWVFYPKATGAPRGAPTMTRANVMRELGRTGWVAVANVSAGDVWSALRARKARPGELDPSRGKAAATHTGDA